MENIEQWFEDGCDFYEGVAIYNSLPRKNNRVLRSLDRGKTSYNKSLLIKELRKYKNTPPPAPEPKRKHYNVKTQTKPRQHNNDEAISLKNKQNTQKQSALKKEYGGVKYAELPQQLRLRYRELGQIFYEMCDLKFILNDLPAKEEAQALQIQLQIEELDQQRILIWNEIDHWNRHRVVLPSEADHYKDLNSDELRTEKAKLASNISRTEKRLKERYELLFNTTNKTEAVKIENSISRSEARVHKAKLNINKINELL